MPLPEPHSLFTQSHGTDRLTEWKTLRKPYDSQSVGHNFNAICPVCQHADNLLTTRSFASRSLLYILLRQPERQRKAGSFTVTT